MAGLFRTHSRVRGSPDGCGYQIGHIRPPGSSLRSLDCRQIRPTTHNCAPLVSRPCWKVGMRTTRCRRPRVPIVNCRIMPASWWTRSEELGLDHFEGRSWQGLHRHALMTMLAFAFLQYRRLQKARWGKKNQRTAASTPQPSLPAVRHAIVALIAQPPPRRCPHCRKWICVNRQLE
jgi:hypothetical protein